MQNIIKMKSLNQRINMTTKDEFIQFFNQIPYEERVKVLDEIIGTSCLDSSYLSVRIMLVSQCIGIYRIYKKKNPDAKLNEFIKKLMGIDKSSLWENRWIDNFCAFSEALTKNCTEIDLGGSKTIPEFKQKIQAVLDLLLPF